MVKQKNKRQIPTITGITVCQNLLPGTHGGQDDLVEVNRSQNVATPQLRMPEVDVQQEEAQGYVVGRQMILQTEVCRREVVAEEEAQIGMVMKQRWKKRR